jgi:predicted transcriptional regulator
MESMSSQLSSVNVERLEQVVEKLKGLTAADTRQMLEVTVLECYAATMMEDVTDISETEAELYRRLRKTLKPLAQYGVTLKEYYRRTDLKKRLTNS